MLDSEGIEATVLYPTMGLAWEAECPDYKLAAAYCRVYNDWILDFCRPNPDRLIPIAHISVSDAEEGANELERTAKIGARGVFLSGYPINGVSYGDPRHDRFWSLAQESDLPVSLHIAATPRQVFDNLYTGGVPENTWWNFLTLANDTFIGFASLFKGAVFDRFPDIKIIVLETGAGFMPYWLDRMDEFYEKFGFATGMQMKPSDYFYKQCWISLEPDDEMAVCNHQRPRRGQVHLGRRLPALGRALRGRGRPEEQHQPPVGSRPVQGAGGERHRPLQHRSCFVSGEDLWNSQ